MNTIIASLRENAPPDPAAREKAASRPPSLIDWKTIWKPLSVIVGIFLVLFWLPIGSQRFTSAIIESLALAKWYAQVYLD